MHARGRRTSPRVSFITIDSLLVASTDAVATLYLRELAPRGIVVGIDMQTLVLLDGLQRAQVPARDHVQACLIVVQDRALDVVNRLADVRVSCSGR